MSEHQSDKDFVAKTKNTARYFTETRHVAWVVLVATVLWGVFSYARMPKAKDPLIQVRVAVASCIWPGARAEKVEQLVTRKIEQKIAENATVEKIESITRSSVSIVYVTLKEDTVDIAKELEDIKAKLDDVNKDLPQGAGAISFLKDFGNTAALMLTVASPRVSEIEIELRAKALERAIEATRKDAPQPVTGASEARSEPKAREGGSEDSLRAGPAGRATLVASFPPSINAATLRRTMLAGARYFSDSGFAQDSRLLEGPGYMGIDLLTDVDDKRILELAGQFARDRMRLSELHPDVWQPTVIRDPKQTKARLAAAASERYSYRELDDFTDMIQRYLSSLPIVSKVSRSGVLPEQIYLEYSQERLAAYNVQQTNLADILNARNITIPGGILEIQGKNVTIDPSGELKSEKEIGGVVAGASTMGLPVYLRDVVDVSRDYQSPPRYLNYLTARGLDGKFQRTRAITLAVQMRPGQQIAEFGEAIDARLREVKKLLPEDLILRRTSDQPLQVEENVELFMNSLYEAIVLVVLVALIGFWEWRSALLMALSIPLTLAMTFGFMHVLGIDIQQISIASLILALGLLVDDPVVAGDAIKRSLDHGWKPLVAAWLGPTKLASAIMFATVTNIVAYLPLLTMGGDVGKFIYSLPVVLTCSLVASRLVSMTFIPLLGYYILRPSKHKEVSPEERRQKGFGLWYSKIVGWSIDHRKAVIALSMLLLVFGFSIARQLKTAFFPQDLSYLSYVDVWLPEDATLSATRNIAREAETVIKETAAANEKELESITTFIGGGGPRFWFSVNPELNQLNYAQLVVQLKDKHDTPRLIPLLQRALSSKIAGARFDARQLENGKPVGIPIQVRIAGEDIRELRRLAEKVKHVFRELPTADRVRDDWGADTFDVKLEVDPDRANLAGVTNADVALSSAVAMNGLTVSVLREGDRQIPIVARLRSDERAQLADVQNLYVNSQRTTQRVPLRQVSRIAYGLQTEKIRRRNQFRTITVAAFPVQGVLPSEVIASATPKLDALAKQMPPGYKLEIGGEQEEQKKGFAQLAIVLGLSIFGIFLALVVQFKNAVKPIVVYAAIPFGVAGALVSLAIMRAPFGFMAFLGIVSLIGVIVSHVIVLFDFIEEMHEKGEPLREALLDAGIVRLRPVLITVGATVLGLFPLALHGGPLWQPLCYAQIGGLSIATFLTLWLVPVIYTFFVQDLGWIRWERAHAVSRHANDEST